MRVFCTYCGASNPDTAAECLDCHTPLGKKAAEQEAAAHGGVVPDRAVGQPRSALSATNATPSGIRTSPVHLTAPLNIVPPLRPAPPAAPPAAGGSVPSTVQAVGPATSYLPGGPVVPAPGAPTGVTPPMLPDSPFGPIPGGPGAIYTSQVAYPPMPYPSVPQPASAVPPYYSANPARAASGPAPRYGASPGYPPAGSVPPQAPGYPAPYMPGPAYPPYYASNPAQARPPYAAPPPYPMLPYGQIPAFDPYTGQPTGMAGPHTGPLPPPGPYYGAPGYPATYPMSPVWPTRPYDPLAAGLPYPADPSQSLQLSAIRPEDLAGAGPRFGAFLLDSFVVGVPLFVLLLIAGATNSTTLAGIWLVLAVLYPAVYFIASWASTGRTVGYKALGLQLVRSDGSQPGVGSAIARFLAVCIGSFFFFPGLLSALWMLWDNKKQTWADKIGDTMVVKS